jgi:hypothetical protein
MGELFGDLASGALLITVLSICIGIGVTIGSIVFVMFLVRRMMNPHGNMKDALDGQATVMKIWETGVRINDQPRVGFLLNVQHPDGSTYEAETTAVISIIHLPSIQPGAKVAVKIHPQDRNKVALA